MPRRPLDAAVPASLAAARFTSLAPGASVSVSSTKDPASDRELVERLALTGPIWKLWTSTPGRQIGQWVRLDFPVPVAVRSVRLYDPRFGDEAGSTIEVERATVRLYTGPTAGALAAAARCGPLAVFGTDVVFPAFGGVQGVRAVHIDLTEVSGTFSGAALARRAEVEVIASDGG